MTSAERTSERPLAGRRALITGAAGGQGRAVAKRFVADGAAVVVLDRDGNGLEELVDELTESGAAAWPIEADVQDPTQVQVAVARAAQVLDGIDVLYNNAAVYDSEHDKPIAELAEADWERVLAVNLSSYAWFCKHVIPHLTQNARSSIINVSSVAGYAGDNATSAYPASKAGVIGLTKSIAYAYGNQGVRANVICPGLIRTPMVAARMSDEELMTTLLANVALGRPGEPEEIAGVAAFLASDDASYVTASVITVHGGMRR